MDRIEVRLPNGRKAMATYRSYEGNKGYVRLMHNGVLTTVSGRIYIGVTGLPNTFSPLGRNAQLVQR